MLNFSDDVWRLVSSISCLALGASDIEGFNVQYLKSGLHRQGLELSFLLASLSGPTPSLISSNTKQNKGSHLSFLLASLSGPTPSLISSNTLDVAT